MTARTPTTSATSERHYAIVEKALQFIADKQLEHPNLAAIAEHCAMSEYHFQKVFSSWAGISPKQFLRSLTREQCRTRLLDGDSLSAASHAAGLSGTGRMHDLFVTLEAVTPGDIKSGGKGLEIEYGLHPCPFGQCFIATTQRGIHRLEFLDPDQLSNALDTLRQHWPHARLVKNPKATRQYVDLLFKSAERDNTKPSHLTLWLKATPFQFKVWEALINVREGQLCSYQQLATLTGQPKAARAVGSAVASNPVAWLIPCHRVIRSMGVTGNYRWGTARKQALLGWEAARHGLANDGV